MKNRKFIGLIIGVITNISLFTVGAVFNVGEIIVVTAMILSTTIVMAYFGGNVWASWVKSKYFVKELNDEPS